MRPFGTWLTLASIAAVVTLGGCQAEEAPSAEIDSDGVVVHISSGPGNAQAVLMGLQMAEIMSEDRDVMVYFDVEAIDLVGEDAVNLELDPFGSSREMMRNLADQGVGLWACPSCMEAAGMSKNELMQGIRVAEKNAFFDFTDGRILTLDY